MKVSVIIPLYNQARFVERAIESALAQPETEEVVVIDDGSEDGGGDLVKDTFADDKRVLCFGPSEHQKRGAGAARNIGIAKAAQPFLAFLDADDYMLPDRFAHTKKVLAAHPDADGVYEALGREESNELTMLKVEVPPERVFEEMDPFGKNGHFSVCGLTVKAHAVRETGGFSEKLVIGEDTEWLARLVLTHRLFGGRPDRAIAIRTVDGRNTTATSRRSYKDKVLMAAILLVWAKSANQPKTVQRILLDLYLKYHYEENRLLTEKSPWSRKRSDFKAALFVMNNVPDFFKYPKFRYFLKTVVGLPVKKHYDYYR